MGQLSSTTSSPSSTYILLSLRAMRQAPCVCHLCCKSKGVPTHANAEREQFSRGLLACLPMHWSVTSGDMFAGCRMTLATAIQS
jgi:hypothetical protein